MRQYWTGRTLARARKVSASDLSHIERPSPRLRYGEDMRNVSFHHAIIARSLLEDAIPPLLMAHFPSEGLLRAQSVAWRPPGVSNDAAARSVAAMKSDVVDSSHHMRRKPKPHPQPQQIDCVCVRLARPRPRHPPSEWDAPRAPAAPPRRSPKPRSALRNVNGRAGAQALRQPAGVDPPTLILTGYPGAATAICPAPLRRKKRSPSNAPRFLCGSTKFSSYSSLIGLKAKKKGSSTAPAAPTTAWRTQEIGLIGCSCFTRPRSATSLTKLRIGCSYRRRICRPLQWSSRCAPAKGRRARVVRIVPEAAVFPPSLPGRRIARAGDVGG
ncbi:hypothetical protein A0H81_05502 [Grifola frondosa]|uniref:Uncharacterized protein n=1 Tax=Grifola frondosa TaxID=5627 RepID=A0A1C7MBL0_GRIFR|nr:hypothetical protein A0H81_05502 [Grifola frondosa]